MISKQFSNFNSDGMMYVWMVLVWHFAEESIREAFVRKDYLMVSMKAQDKDRCSLLYVSVC
jgi:hypothetical protein